MKDIANNQLMHDGDTIALQVFRIDINNYIFEREKLNYYNNQLRSRNLNLVIDSAQVNKMMYIDYQTAFYPNQTGQSDRFQLPQCIISGIHRWGFLLQSRIEPAF